VVSHFDFLLKGKIDRSIEPFSIRQKKFWPLSDTKTLLGPKFTKESLGHEPDGLIFQPADDVSLRPPLLYAAYL
jgi:hypothetical protein